MIWQTWDANWWEQDEASYDLDGALLLILTYTVIATKGLR